MAEKVFVVTVNVTVSAKSQKAAEQAAEAAAHRTCGCLDACVVGSEKLTLR